MAQEPESIDVTEPAVLIRISQLFDPRMSAEALYEATRGVWKMGPRREAARYAMAVAEGIVREVYEIGRWHPAGSTPYATRGAAQVEIEDRWEFTGGVAPATSETSTLIGQSRTTFPKARRIPSCM